MPKIVNRDEMRADLMTGCFSLFAQKGFAAVTMRDLAAELKVSTGTLYHYFANKSELFQQMLRHLVERDTEQVLARITGTERTVERIQILMEYVSQKEEHFSQLLFLLFDFKRQQLKAKGKAKQDAFRELLSVYRKTITENAGFQDSRLGHIVLSLIIGTLVQRIADPVGAPLSEVQAFLFETFADVLPANA